MSRTIQHAVTLAAAVYLSFTGGFAYAENQQGSLHVEIELIDSKMDDLHKAAAEGDSIRYLNHFAEDSVFMGTDDWERWPYVEFSKYVNKHFKGGKGWSYRPVKRHTNLNLQRTFAWVDEIVASTKWGRFRGTAVLVNSADGWKLKHYSLTKLVPNEVWEEVSGITQKAYSTRKLGAGLEPPAEE
jgi:hypothetical protein